MIRLLRSALVIARRDFAATVLSKTFIFFLLGPLFPLLLGGVFGSIGARVASQTDQPTIIVAMSHPDYGHIAQGRDKLAAAIGDKAVVRLIHVPTTPTRPVRPDHLLSESGLKARAVLSGTIADARLDGDVHEGDPIARQVRWFLEQPAVEQAPKTQLTVTAGHGATSGSLTKDRALTAQIGQMLLFFLTILLSGMVLSQLIEEKSNKIIEVIAAAVPIDALFIGKLLAMLAASVIGILVWVSAGAFLIDLLKTGGVRTLPPPAVGWPAFLALGIAYFAMNYLLLGAVFLTIGAQASTAREVQIMSMPITFAQVLIFGFATTAVGAPGSPLALAAAIFPLSSPMTMLARAAELPDLWPHAAALAWQALWVALILRLGAALFRKTVLKSGPRMKWWQLRRA
jgi:ABC-2 type transport system permease protein